MKSTYFCFLETARKPNLVKSNWQCHRPISVSQWQLLSNLKLHVSDPASMKIETTISSDSPPFILKPDERKALHLSTTFPISVPILDIRECAPKIHTVNKIKNLREIQPAYCYTQ